MRNRSIRTTYMLLLFIVIMPLFVFFTIFTHSTMNRVFDNSASISVEQAKLSLTDHIIMTEKSYELVGDQFQKYLMEVSEVYKAEYEHVKNIDKIDYAKLKSLYGDLIDLYVIDSRGIIIRSTYPPALGLDFNKISSDFVKTLNNIRLGNKTIISKITEDLTNGHLRKWSYIPTSDHKYILEIGINSAELEKYVKHIDYQKLVDDFKAVNPLLADIRIYSSGYNELSMATPITDPKIKQIVQNVIQTQLPYTEYDDNDKLKREFFFINSLTTVLLDTEKVIDITYDYSEYTSYLNSSVRYMVIFFALYVIFILLIISWVTRGIITTPLEELSKRMWLFSKDRKYNKLKIKKKDEIGHLVEAYNHLVDELHSASESKKYYKEKSTRDHLTGLYNRHYIMDRFHKFCAKYSEQERPFAFVIWDIDHFKDINDTYGHSVGDEVLQRISGVLSQMVGDEGVVARYGGEEFVAIVHLDNSDVIKITETIRILVEQKLQTTQKVSVTISAGIAFYDELIPHEDYKNLIDIADKRLYVAKNSGRNRVVYPEL